MKYQVTVGERTWLIDIQGDRVSADGAEHQADLRAVEGTPLRVLVLDGDTWVFPMENGGGGAWAVIAQGERYDVEAVDERTAHARGVIGLGGKRVGPRALKAPMPGLVVRVLVEPGQSVEAGASLVVLEAMKMENLLKSATAGVVQTVNVTAGQTVEKGQILATFGADE